eukprot:SAG31_NODE_1500_length_8090_cov_10.522588_13_plen_112_part_01
MAVFNASTCTNATLISMTTHRNKVQENEILDAVKFESLTKVGEQWAGGTWGKLDSKGMQIKGTCGDQGSKPCSRGEPGVTMLQSPRSSAALLVLSPTAVVAMGNDTAQISVD